MAVLIAWLSLPTLHHDLANVADIRWGDENEVGGLNERRVEKLEIMTRESDANLTF